MNDVVGEAIKTLEEILIQSEERNKQLRKNVINTLKIFAVSRMKENDYSVRVVIPPPLEDGTCSMKCNFFYQNHRDNDSCTREWSVQLSEEDAYSYGPGCPRYVQPVEEEGK